MFGFGKKKKEERLRKEKEENDKKKSHTDKLVMGAIVGVAVGSVVGISLKGKKSHENQPQQQEPLLIEPKEPRSRMGKFFKKLFGRKKKEKTAAHNKLSPRQQFKKIPNEWE